MIPKASCNMQPVCVLVADILSWQLCLFTIIIHHMIAHTTTQALLRTVMSVYTQVAPANSCIDSQHPLSV